MQFKNVLIISDIEGSSGCWSYSDSSLMTRGWRGACIGMTEDVGNVVAGLFDAGVQRVSVHDFHRTGYNILHFIRLCYLTPRIEKNIPAGLFLYNLLGRLGLARVRLSLYFSA